MKSNARDVKAGEQPMSRLPQTGDPLPGGKAQPVVPPTATTSPPSPTQPNIAHPERMRPTNPAAASEPVVPAGGATYRTGRTTTEPFVQRSRRAT
jgi:hypothetical protein